MQNDNRDYIITIVSLMRAFVNVFVLRQFGPLRAVALTRLRLTIVGPTRRGKELNSFTHRDRDASVQQLPRGIERVCVYRSGCGRTDR
jgi:hypothetical protein